MSLISYIFLKITFCKYFYIFNIYINNYTNEGNILKVILEDYRYNRDKIFSVSEVLSSEKQYRIVPRRKVFCS